MNISTFEDFKEFLLTLLAIALIVFTGLICGAALLCAMLAILFLAGNALAIAWNFSFGAIGAASITWVNALAFLIVISAAISLFGVAKGVFDRD